MKSNRKHQSVDWDSIHDRIILYADIMGFKAKLNSTSHEDVTNELRKFIKAVSKHISPYQTGGHIRMTLFSDLIVIAADRTTIPNFRLIVKAAAALMQECHTFNYPINGCIACGALTFDEAESLDLKATRNKSVVDNYQADEPEKTESIHKGQYMPLFVGKSVVDAYQLNEEMFFYGLVLHPSAEKIFHETLELKYEKDNLPFHKIPVALKSGGVARLYYLNWPDIKLAKNTASLQDVKNWLDELEQKVGVRPRAYIYNTRNIIDQIEKQLIDTLP